VDQIKVQTANTCDNDAGIIVALLWLSSYITTSSSSPSSLTDLLGMLQLGEEDAGGRGGGEADGQADRRTYIEIQMQIQRDQRSAFVPVGRFKALGLRRPKGRYEVLRRVGLYEILR
jgi:hypothetical protein